MAFDMLPDLPQQAQPASRVDTPLLREVVLRARRYIANPNTWVRGAWAQDRYGKATTDASAPDAVRFCAEGAIERAAFELVGKDDYKTLARSAIASVFPLLFTINDFEGRLAVLKLFDDWLARGGRADTDRRRIARLMNTWALLFDHCGESET
jgi:hypothetical protein